MNDYGGRLPGENEAQYGAGSVRRARERMEAGLPPDNSQVKAGYDQRANGPSPPNPLRKQVQQEATGSSIGENAIGVAISRPIPAPQWPLMDSNIVPQQFASDPAYRPPPGRTVAPQRPPRPSRVPSILDASQPQEHVPSFAYNAQSQRKPPRTPQYPDEDLFSPGGSNPRSPETPSGSSGSGSSSRPSTMSSVGTIPDFPLPTIAPGPRRSGNLGPPPSARRGASSYYSSHASYVSPIPEESPRTQRSHSSYASSAAIPSSWGSADPEYYYDEQSPDYDSRGIMSEHGIIEEGRESRESNYDGNEEQSLVRQASVGKRGKPALINTKSTENVDSMPRSEQIPQQPPQQADDPPAPGLWGLRESRVPDEAAVAAAVAAGFAANRQAGSRETAWPTGEDPNPPTIPNIPPDSATYDSSRPSLSTESTGQTTASSETMPNVGRALSSSERMSYRPAPRPPVPPVPERSDARGSRTIGAQQVASAMDPSNLPAQERGFSRLSAIRRPPRLDIDAVRKAEARGSLTSLPDLIKRATRLAAMMDKGRRPASRFDWATSPGGRSVIGFERRDGTEGMEMPSSMNTTILNEKNQSSGLGDMLNAFPAPGLATPTREAEGRPMPQSPKFPNEKSSFDVAKDQQRGRKQRRCCGLPLCGFLVIIIIVLMAVVAGIVVPIELLVVHKATPTASTQLTLASCIAEVTCLNGGKNDISSGVCSCICVNGFTGATCASDTDTVGCGTANIGGSTAVNNVTLGDALPRIIAQAESNFTVPLTSTVILSRLNAANLSCVSQNALVTFNGADDRSATTSNSGEAVLPVVQEVSVGITVIGGIGVTVTVGDSGRHAATASETIALAGTSTANAASNSVTVELGSTTINANTVTVGLGSTTANANTVTVGLSGTNTAAAAVATPTSSVTIDLEGSSTGSVTVNLGSTTAASSVTVSLGSTTLKPTSSTTTATTAATTTATTTASSTASFAASQEMLDFARVAVLYVLQQQNLSTAMTAQVDLQQFLSMSGATSAAARNVSLSNGNSIDLIDFAVNVGAGNVGALTSTASKKARMRRDPRPYNPQDF